MMSIVTVDFYQFARSDIPALLGSMGIANTMATFVFANFLTRVAATKHRRTASLAVVLSWLSMITVAMNYALDIRIYGIAGIFVQVGLITWLSAFWYSLNPDIPIISKWSGGRMVYCPHRTQIRFY